MADRHVLDASAILALLDGAPNADHIAAIIDTALVSSLSVALVAAELTRRGADPQEVASILHELHLNVVAFGFDQAIDTGTFGPKVSDEITSLEHWAWSALVSKTGAIGFTGEQRGISAGSSARVEQANSSEDDCAGPAPT